MPVREQLITQVTLGIASGDLAVGDRLPSTREIARRYGIHPNTVAGAYKSLVDRNIVEFRHGSGYYISDRSGGDRSHSDAVEQLIDDLVSAAHDAGLSTEELLMRLRIRTGGTGLGKILLIESDTGLRDLLIHEIDTALRADISAISFEEFAAEPFMGDAILTALFDEKPKIDPLLKNGPRCIYLNGRSVATVLSGETRPAENETIAVASVWDGFLNIARVMLTAAKIEPGNMIIRSTRDDGWLDAVERASIVVCDSLTAASLENHKRMKVFSVIADESLAELSGSLK